LRSRRGLCSLPKVASRNGTFASARRSTITGLLTIVLGATFAVAPSSATSSPTATSLASDGAGYCAIVKGGEAYCWGPNADGSLGSGSTVTSSNVPVKVKGLTGAVSVVGDLNDNGYCAVLRSGAVNCWGYNGDGQLGNGSSVAFSNVAVPVTGLTGVKSLASDGFAFCAVLEAGTVSCWGNNADGALGYGNDGTNDSDVPVAVTGLTGALTVVGVTFNDGFCAGLKSGGVSCWGTNGSGQLGNGSTISFSPSPVVATGVKHATTVGSNGDDVCAGLKSGGVQCWGYDGSGQLGSGSAGTTARSPVAVAGKPTVSALLGNESEGGSFCAVLKRGGVSCWGGNGFGELGNGGSEVYSDSPVTAKGVTRAKTVVAGIGSYCAALKSGDVSCWGNNTDGTLGVGSTEQSSNVPVTVKGLSGVTALGGTGNGYCAVEGKGGVECWGDNLDGLLGSGSPELFSSSPVAVKGLR
jgi:alpha-tubulin suppressor-like RCC1 family protein